jgi:hypothetical protein
MVWVDKDLVVMEGIKVLGHGVDNPNGLLRVEVYEEEGDHIVVVLPQEPLNHSNLLRIPLNSSFLVTSLNR